MLYLPTSLRSATRSGVTSPQPTSPIRRHWPVSVSVSVLVLVLVTLTLPMTLTVTVTLTLTVTVTVTVCRSRSRLTVRQCVGLQGRVPNSIGPKG
jgi:Flp pilus assembly protein TadB